MSSAQDEKITPVFDEGTQGRQYDVRPTDIDLSKTGCGFFGKHEVEVAACRLVKFFCRKGGWVAFTLEELAHYYSLSGWPTSMMLYGLHGCWADDGSGCYRMAPPYLVDFGTDHFRVTEFFIERCLTKPV